MNQTYTVSVNVDPKFVRQFNMEGYSLCFAAGVTDDPNKGANDAQFNVVAYTERIGQAMSIDLKESYAVAATRDRFMNGVQLSAATSTSSIKFGQSYTLPDNWTDGQVVDDSSAPQEGFNFHNKASNAAAIVYKEIQGSRCPIYVSQQAPLPSGTERLVPKACCAIWFARRESAQTGSMVSRFDTNPLKIDLGRNSSGRAEVSYSQDGNWKIVSNN